MNVYPVKIAIAIERTDYAPGVDNVWVVRMGSEHSPAYRTVDEALVMVRAMMERIENDQTRPPDWLRRMMADATAKVGEMLPPGMTAEYDQTPLIVHKQADGGEPHTT